MPRPNPSFYTIRPKHDMEPTTYTSIPRLIYPRDDTPKTDYMGAFYILLAWFFAVVIAFGIVFFFWYTDYRHRPAHKLDPADVEMHGCPACGRQPTEAGRKRSRAWEKELAFVGWKGRPRSWFGGSADANGQQMQTQNQTQPPTQTPTGKRTERSGLRSLALVDDHQPRQQPRQQQQGSQHQHQAQVQNQDRYRSHSQTQQRKPVATTHTPNPFVLAPAPPARQASKARNVRRNSLSMFSPSARFEIHAEPELPPPRHPARMNSLRMHPTAGPSDAEAWVMSPPSPIHDSEGAWRFSAVSPITPPHYHPGFVDVELNEKQAGTAQGMGAVQQGQWPGNTSK